jgi:S-DNA-T family DNA segregation ATPase FtsK/SpoIIIE
VLSVIGDKCHARSLTRAIICQLAVMHEPGLVAIAAVVEGAASEWEWLKWLPHHQHPGLTDLGGAARLRYDSVDAAVADRGSAAHTVVVVDGAPAGGPRVERGDVTIVAIGDETRLDIPRASLRIHVSADEIAVIGEVREVVARPDAITLSQAESCARRLAPFRPSGDSTGVAPGGKWAQLIGIEDPANFDPENTWRRLDSHNRLRVAVGVTAQGSPVELDLKEAAEQGMGPHGLCVGATGSGKSEFLRTLTLGLIASHPPESLNLVLVDFKGGATFLGLERARHVAALITNLSEEAHLVARMKDALAGEMNRRQELLRSTGGFASVADYERARERGAPLAPLPSLVVIVDEFSELLSQHPDFAELFVAIGRLGRSLRMHLLLATQRLDEGRLRGLDSHLSYRVCLKTFSANESRTVIGIPDAFHLPATPGAGFLRVSSGEPVAFQTAYVSGPCTPTTTGTSAAPGVRVFNAAPMGSVIAADRSQGYPSTARTVLDTVVARVARRGVPAHGVWLPPLGESPSLVELLADRHVPMTVPIGVVDRPFDQRRDVLQVELAGAAGNVAIVGAPQSGKSTALRTLVTSLAATHSPADVQIYCLDFGGGALSALAGLPHVGAVAGRTDTDLVRRTVAELTTLLRKREASGQKAADGFGEVFLAIDGWASLREDFDALEQPIAALAARGLSYGIHVVLTASRWAEIRPGLKDQIGTRIELRLGDAGDSELSRAAAQRVPFGRPGRGITRDGLHMLIALPKLDPNGKVQARFGDGKAPRVRLLPQRVDLDALIAHRQDAPITIGLDEDELALVGIDFVENPHVLILGDSECGKTAALRLICAELIRTRSADEAQLVVVDYRRTLLGAVETDHLIGYAISETVLAAQLPTLVERLRTRIPGPEVDQKQLRTRSWWSGPDIYLIVDDYDLVSAGAGSLLAPIIELLPYAKDLGLHLVVARRSGGAGRALYEPLLGRLRELGSLGIMMSTSSDEGVLLGTSRSGPMPPGRARIVTRAGERIVQLAWLPPCP